MEDDDSKGKSHISWLPQRSLSNEVTFDMIHHPNQKIFDLISQSTNLENPIINENNSSAASQAKNDMDPSKNADETVTENDEKNNKNQNNNPISSVNRAITDFNILRPPSNPNFKSPLYQEIEKSLRNWHAKIPTPVVSQNDTNSKHNDSTQLSGLSMPTTVFRPPLSSGNKIPDQPHVAHKRSERDFIFSTRLGRGSYGEVYKAQSVFDKYFYAIKIISKKRVFKEKRTNAVKIERDAMLRLDHNNIIKLKCSFQNSKNLYFCMEYAENGDLSKVLSKYIALNYENTQQICAQVLSALGHMHKRRVLHRDIKPENILLNSNNIVKISDFGTAKLFERDSEFRATRGSFVGSADYVSPEVLTESPIGPGSDIWSFGCLIYRLLVGEAPFHAESNYRIFQNIQKVNYAIPDFVPKDARDLIEKILILDPDKRLGSSTYDDEYSDIKSHPFFKGIDWNKIPNKILQNWESFEPAVQKYEKNKNEKMEAENDVFEETIIRESVVKISSKDQERKTEFSENNELIEAVVTLTNRPRIYISDMSKKTIYSELPITMELKFNVSNDKLIISNTSKEIIFYANKEELDDWEKLLESVLKEL